MIEFAGTQGPMDGKMTEQIHLALMIPGEEVNIMGHAERMGELAPLSKFRPSGHRLEERVGY